MLAVGLGTCVYLWFASSSKVTKLCDLVPRDSVCAVHWIREGSYLAVGPGHGDVKVSVSSVTTLAWNSTILSSGSRDKSILQHDIRVPNDYISKFSGHRSEVNLWSSRAAFDSSVDAEIKGDKVHFSGVILANHIGY